LTKTTLGRFIRTLTSIENELSCFLKCFLLLLTVSSCCASRFTWASTSDSAAQEARDKHNCRSCGSLVCDPCSGNQIPLPSIGITVNARVCDRCYHDICGAAAAAKHPNNSDTSPVSIVEGQRLRHRERRSPVVDDLASRVRRPRAAAHAV
jgi:hypothetical protein